MSGLILLRIHVHVVSYKHMKYSPRSFYTFILLIFLVTSGYADTATLTHQNTVLTTNKAKTVTFGCAFQPDNHTFQRLKKNLSAIWNNLGYEVNLQHMPHSRVGFELEQGRIDGDCARALIYSHQHNNIFFIRSWITPRYIYAYQRTEFAPDFSPRADLKDKRIVFIRGSRAVSEFLQENQLKGFTVTTQKQAVKMVAGGHADVLIGFRAPIEGTLDTVKFKGKLHKKAISDEIPIYIAIHKRHLHLKAKIEEQISRRRQNLQ